jgi:hypothetical protein
LSSARRTGGSTIEPIVVLIGALAIAWIVGFGMRAARLAARARRSPERWFLFGAILGPAALIILRAAPPGTCGICLSPVIGWDLRCGACGSDVRDRPSLERGPAVAADSPGQALEAAFLATPTPASPNREADAPGDAGRGARARSRRRATPSAIGPASAGETGGLTEPSAAPGSIPVDGTSVLATAVFVEGSEPMSPGVAYVLVQHGQDLRIMGPADGRPDHIVLSRRLRELAPTALGDRLIITGTSRRLDDFYLSFTSVQGGTAQHVARELDVARKAASDARREAG